MENLAIVLRQLRDECKQAQLQADKLEEAISVLKYWRNEVREQQLAASQREECQQRGEEE